MHPFDMPNLYQNEMFFYTDSLRLFLSLSFEQLKCLCYSLKPLR